MTDIYHRPASPNPPLLYVGGATPIITPELAYEVFKGPEDFNLTKTTSFVPVGWAISPGLQKGVSALGVLVDFLNAMGEAREQLREVGISWISEQFKEQLQPGQAAEVVFSGSSVKVFSGGHSELMTPGTMDSGEVRVINIEKPGPGDLMCFVSEQSKPATTVFTFKDAEGNKTTIMMEPGQLRSNEVPVEQSSKPTSFQQAERPDAGRVGADGSDGEKDE